MTTYDVQFLDEVDVRVRAYLDGDLIADEVVNVEQVVGLAEATLAARDEWEARPREGVFRIGDRVIQGADPVVRSEFYGQTATVVNDHFYGQEGHYILEFADGQSQVTRTEYLTHAESDEMPVLVPGPDAEDDDAGTQEAVMKERLIAAGVRVRILDEPVVFGKDADEPDDGVYFEPGTVATISAWEDDADEDYCTERNFFLIAEDGLRQVVAIRSTEPLDEYKEVINDMTRSVGAEFAERRGIVAGATVAVPGLEGILFGTGTVTDVTADGMATVSLAGVMEREYPAFVLRAADDDG